jgi:aspartate aminotransferase
MKTIHCHFCDARMLSQRLRFVKPSPTLALNQRAKALEAQGVPIINLSLGEPDFDTPTWILDGAQRAMEQGLTRYTDVIGIPQLRQAIQEKFQKDNALSYAMNELIVSTGGKQVIFNAFMATIDAGDEVIIPAPYWVSYVDMVELLGGTSVIVPCSREQHYKLQAKQLAAVITKKTKWLILNSPSNPTGAVYTHEELRQLAQVLQTNPHVWVLSDDIYEHLVYEDTKFWNLPMVSPELKERCVVVNGVSKSHAMTGWRIGYGGGPASIIQAMATLQSQITSNPCSVAQGAALSALTIPHADLSQWKYAFQQRRDGFIAALNLPQLPVFYPQGAFYLYVDCSALLGATTPNWTVLQSDQDVCEYLLTTAHVAVVPGSAFGGEPAFRVSTAASLAQLEDAAQRIRKAVLALT